MNLSRRIVLAAALGLLALGGAAWSLMNVNVFPMMMELCGDERRGAFAGLLFLFFGIAGWLVAPFILSVLGIIFGAMARKEIANDPAVGGRGMANWGFWLSITGLAAWIILIVVLIAVGNSNS